MIDEKKIEEATRYYCNNRYPASPDVPFIAEGFRRGAKWAIEQFLKDLWHSGKEEPDLNKDSYLLVQFADKSVSIHKIPWIKELVHNQWEGYDIFNWLYLDDLFPKKGGEQ